MKFSNGCWLQKEGCGCFAPTEAYFVKVTDTDVTICAPTTHITNRGATLGGINLTVKISSPRKDVLRVQTYHHLGTVKKNPEFDLNIEKVALETTQEDNLITIKSGDLSLEITKKPWSMTYKRDGKVLTKSTGKDLAIMKTDWKGDAYDKGDLTDTYMRQQLSARMLSRYQNNYHFGGSTL